MILVIPSSGVLNISALLQVASTGTGTVVTGIANPSANLPTPIIVIHGQSGSITMQTLTMTGALTNATNSFTAGGVIELAQGYYRLDFTASSFTGTLRVTGENTASGLELFCETYQVCSSNSAYLGANALTLNGTSPSFDANGNIIANGSTGVLTVGSGPLAVGTNNHLLTVDTLTNAPSVPTAAQIAAANWAFLANNATVSGSMGAFIAANLSISTGQLLVAINALQTAAIPGAYTASLTVDDGTNPVQAATLRLSLNGVSQGSFTTDVNGNATTSIDNHTYGIAITYPGFQFSPTIFAAGTGGSFTFHMTRLTPAAAPNPSECRIQDYLTDQSGQPLGGAVIAWYLQTPDIHTGTRSGTIVSDATSGYWYLDVQQGTGPYILDRSRIANVIFPQITVTALNTTGSSYIIGT